MDKTYNIFISHSWNYSDEYDRLKRLLDKSGIKYRDYSVPKNDPIHNAKNDKELKEAIKNQMRNASVIIVLAGVYSTYSKWINIEMELAKEGFFVDKKIIAVELFGSERTSSIVKQKADKIVKWNSLSIANAIKELG